MERGEDREREKERQEWGRQCLKSKGSGKSLEAILQMCWEAVGGGRSCSEQRIKE